MAGLTDELLSVLNEEEKLYEELLPYAEQKSAVIVENNIKKLEEITEFEQLSTEKLKKLEKQREEIMKNIRIVLNIKTPEFKLEDLINKLDRQPEVQKNLREVKARLKTTISTLEDYNFRNGKLLKSSLEIAEYGLNVIRSTKSYIGNNYTRRAGQFDAQIMQPGTFDAKQ